jgi:hypothetical protein
MAKRSEIEHRYSYLQPGDHLDRAADSEGFYQRGSFPGTAARMGRFAHHAIDLAQRAANALMIKEEAGFHNTPGASLLHWLYCSRT